MSVRFMSAVSFGRVTANVLELCVRAGFGVQSFNLLLKFLEAQSSKFARQPA